MKRWLLLVLMVGLRPTMADPNRDLQISVGEDAYVELLPRNHPHIAEFVLHEVTEDITALEDVSTADIDEFDVINHGGGEWVVKLYLVEAGTHMVPMVHDGVLTMALSPDVASPNQVVIDAPSVDALLDESAVSGEPEDVAELSFLHGDSMSGQLDPETYPLHFGEPDWLESDPGGWHRIQEDHLSYLRAQQCTIGCAQASARAMHDLGWRYIEIGWDLEGRHYLDMLPANNAAIFKPLLTARSRARAAIETDDWDAAREQLGLAWEMGEPLAEVVEALGIVSLASGSPAREPTGRLLANVSGDPYAQLLAAQLLQLDGFYTETIPLLRPLPNYFEAAGDQEHLAKASLRLGDAYLKAGQFDEALQAWQRADEPLRLYRRVYAQVYRSGADAWVAALPVLLEWGMDDSELAAESKYLVAQIDEALGIDIDAMERFAEMVDEHPETTDRSDIPERLWNMYARRVRKLYGQQKWYLLASHHESVWRDALYDHIDDPTVLWMASQGYERIGLVERALDVLSIGFAKMTSESQTNPEMTIHLAHLYELLGDDLDGLKTLDFLREQGVPGDLRGLVALMSGRMLFNRGEFDDARRELRAARQFKEQESEAMLILALVEAKEGRCDRAVPALTAQLMTEKGLQTYTDPLPYFELSRCAQEEGRDELASQAAMEAASRSMADSESNYGNYVGQMYGDSSVVPEPLQEGEDIWSSLGQNEAEQEAFEQQLARRLNP